MNWEHFNSASPRVDPSSPGPHSVLGSRLLVPGSSGRRSRRLRLCTRAVGPGSHSQRRALDCRPEASRWSVGAAAATRAGMSRSSKVVLGLSVVLTVATVAGVHLKQRQEQQVGVTRPSLPEPPQWRRPWPLRSPHGCPLSLSSLLILSSGAVGHLHALAVAAPPPPPAWPCALQPQRPRAPSRPRPVHPGPPPGSLALRAEVVWLPRALARRAGQ